MVFYWETGNYTIAVIKGNESYDLIKTSCSNIFKDVNQIVKDSAVDIDGKKIPLEMHLGGDYKVKTLYIYIYIYIYIYKNNSFTSYFCFNFLPISFFFSFFY